MNGVEVTDNGRIILLNGEGGETARVDLWAFLEPDERLRAATYLIGITKISGAIDNSTLQKFKEKAEYRLKTIEEFAK